MTATVDRDRSTTAGDVISDRSVVSGTDATREMSKHDRVSAILIDGGAAVLATLLAGYGFRNTYGGSTWLVAIVVAAVVAAVIGVVTRLRGWSPLSTVVAGLAGLLLAGGVSVPDAAVAGVLPTPSTATALFDGVTRGWSRILTTVPPVGSEDHLVAVAYVVCFVATFLAVLLARGTKLTWVPALPSLAVLVTAILLGTEAAPSAVLSGGLLAVLVVAWSALRWQRRREVLRLGGSSTDHQRRTAVVFLGGVTAVGLLLGSVLPGVDRSDRFVVREHTEPPFDPRAYPSPLSQYKGWRLRAHPEGRERLDNTAVLTVSGLPKDVPLQLASLDLYDGTVWHVGGSPQDDTGSSRFERVGTDLTKARIHTASEATPTPDTPSRNVSVTVRNEGYDGPWLPIPPGATSISFSGDRQVTLARGLRYNRATETAAVTSNFKPGDTLSVRADVPEASYVPDAKRTELVGGGDVDQAVRLPAIFDPTQTLGGEANKLGVGGTAYAKARALEQALRAKGSSFFSDGTGTDGQNFTAGHTAGKLKSFLNQVSGDRSVYVGNSEKFAAAMATLARQLDLPARVVVGFREGANDKNPAKRSGNTVTFAADHYDAWVEIAFDGVGWVAFFPTPPRANGAPPPPRSTEPEVKDAEVQARPPVVPPPDVETINPQRKKTNETRQQQQEDDSAVPSWLTPIIRYVGLTLAVIAALGLAVLGWKAWRRRRRRLGGEPVDRLNGAWREMADSLRDAGHRVTSEGTRLQMAETIPEERWDGASAFAERVDGAMFGADPPDADRAAEVWTDVDDLRTHLSQGRGFFGRLAQSLNPKTLWSWK